MKRLFIKTFPDELHLLGLFEKKEIVKPDQLKRYNLPKFKDFPLVICNYFCKGYDGLYFEKGLVFKTDDTILYATPTDSGNYVRSANWIPGHEQFIFSTIDEMLKKYPSSIAFQKKFDKYFKNLSPFEVYPDQPPEHAEFLYDYEMDIKEPYETFYNEIAFEAPLKIKPLGIFHNKKDLINLLSKEEPKLLI